MSVNQVNQTTGALSPIAGGTLYADEPIGAILPFGGSTAPNGFLLCNGQSLLRTEYAELFAVIGTSFGSADSTHFNVPDLRDKFPEGASTTNTLGSTKNAGLPNITGSLRNGWGDRSAITVIMDNVHTGALRAAGSGASEQGIVTATSITPTAGYADSIILDASSSNSIYGNSSTVQPPAVCVNYIIKAKSVALPTDFASAVDDAIDAKIVDSVTDGNMKAVTSNAVYDALFKGVSDYDGSHPVVSEVLTTGTLKNVEVTTTEDNTIYYIYAGNGSNSTVATVVLSVQMNNKTIYVNRIINVNYGVVAYTTPPIKKGVKVTFNAEATFTNGTANLYVYKLT